MENVNLEDRDSEEEITTGVCAAHHGLTSEAIRLAIRRGDMPGRKVGPRNFKVTVRDCLAYEPDLHRQVSGKKGARARHGLEPVKEKPQRGERRGKKPRYDGPLKSLAYRIPMRLYERIKAEGEARGVTATEAAREALEEKFGGG